MGLEIERKFAVLDEGWKRGVARTSKLQQGYLSSNAKATVRVRIVDGASALLTLKGMANGISRAEFEYAIPLDEGLELLEMARPHVVEKVRHEVKFSGQTWEIDVFEGRHTGLVIAEVELSSDEQTVVLPPWIGIEVSADGRFKNASLSRSDIVPSVDPDAA